MWKTLKRGNCRNMSEGEMFTTGKVKSGANETEKF
jgi:hypothetical protein